MWPLLALISAAIHAVIGSEYMRFGTIPRQFECYSCMSLSYQENWEHLQFMYTTPKVFTNRCNDPFLQRNIPTVLCGSYCASLLEPNVEGGVFLGYKYIRGCVDRILRHGFNQSALRTHRFNQVDQCRSLPRAQLFNPPRGVDMPVFGDVQLCSCYGDKCNGASGTSGLHHSLVPCIAWYLFAFTWKYLFTDPR
uniref:Protein quiver n=1 Tax=Panagrellus redivivus TaxID=6233 RepID=A0A7E4W355_PANRE